MHASYRSVFAAIAAAAFLFAARPVSAALSPGTVKKMKEAATDVVGVTITKVSVTRTQVKFGYTRKEIAYEAVVTDVTRSKSKINQGDRISIQSYRLSGYLLPPGPANPPLLAKDWKGTIYLNEVEGNKQFRIAVYGHSFEPEAEQPATDAGR